MQTPERQHAAALAAVYLDALALTEQVETALLACLDLFEKLEALRPESRLTEETIRVIMRAAAAHVMGNEGSPAPRNGRPGR